MYQGIIFDLDGVICSTDQYHYQAWKRLADEEGIYFDETINNRLRGVGRMESLEIILERATRSYSDAEKAALVERKNNTYKALLQNMTPADLDPVVRETLDSLRTRGILLAIGSSSRNARYILERIGLSDYFDEISDGNNIRYSKPDPEVFRRAAEYLRLPSAACLVVDDAEAGIVAAINGGFDSAAIGDSVNCGLATYNLDRLQDLLFIAA